MLRYQPPTRRLLTAKLSRRARPHEFNVCQLAKQTMKLTLIVLQAFILFSCKESSQHKQDVPQKDGQAQPSQYQSERQMVDSSGFDEMVFGRFCKECPSNCAPMFRLNTMGNTSTLWADLEDNYFKGDSALKFTASFNDQKKMAIAYQIMEQLPQALRRWKTDAHTFGCPDCSDGCGIYVEFITLELEGEKKRFWLDWQKSDTVPAEITAYAAFVNQSIDKLIQ